MPVLRDDRVEYIVACPPGDRCSGTLAFWMTSLARSTARPPSTCRLSEDDRVCAAHPCRAPRRCAPAPWCRSTSCHRPRPRRPAIACFCVYGGYDASHGAPPSQAFASRRRGEPKSRVRLSRSGMRDSAASHTVASAPRAKRNSTPAKAQCRWQAKARAAPNPKCPGPRWTSGPDRPYADASGAAGGVDARRWRIVSSNPAMSAASTPPPSATIQTFEPSLAGVAALGGSTAP